MGAQPQLHADNLKCVSRIFEVLLGAARFTTGYARLVGQELAPKICLLMSSSTATRADIEGWVLSEVGDMWTVMLGWAPLLLVIRGLQLVAAVPLDVHGRCRVVRAMLIAGALHAVEASAFSHCSLLKLRSAIVAAVWSRRQPLAHGSTVFCIVWFRIRLMRRYLAYHSEQLRRVWRIMTVSGEVSPEHGPVHVLLESAAEIGFL